MRFVVILMVLKFMYFGNIFVNGGFEKVHLELLCFNDSLKIEYLVNEIVSQLIIFS